MAVVTISGQAGSGGHEIGRLAAEHLQFDYVDQEILVAAAQALGVPVEAVVSLDERTASLGERLAGMLRRFLERSAAAGATDPMFGSGGLDVLLGRTYTEAAAAEGIPDLSDDRYVSTLTDVIRDLAAHDDVVIIGRGSQVILKDQPRTAHVLLAAPLEQRIEAFARREGLDPEDAEKAVQDRDQGRIAFHQKFFKVDVNDPALYDLTLNTARFSVEEAAAIVADVTRRVAAQATPS